MYFSHRKPVLDAMAFCFRPWDFDNYLKKYSSEFALKVPIIPRPSKLEESEVPTGPNDSPHEIPDATNRFPDPPGTAEADVGAPEGDCVVGAIGCLEVLQHQSR